MSFPVSSADHLSNTFHYLNLCRCEFHFLSSDALQCPAQPEIWLCKQQRMCLWHLTLYSLYILYRLHSLEECTFCMPFLLEKTSKTLGKWHKSLFYGIGVVEVVVHQLDVDQSQMQSANIILSHKQIKLFYTNRYSNAKHLWQSESFFFFITSLFRLEFHFTFAPCWGASTFAHYSNACCASVHLHIQQCWFWVKLFLH